MLLQLATWQEIEAYLQKSSAIVLPIGSTEQHGPNGLLGTDAICPEVLAKQVSIDTNCLIAPTINIGMAQHHLAFPGSISLRPSTLIAVIADIVNSLARHGFKQFYFLNGHGGNIATINAAFAEIYAAFSFKQTGDEAMDIEFRLRNWWEGKRVADLSKELFPGSEGMHATPSEVSLSYFAYPDQVKAVAMQPDIAPSGTIRDAVDYRRQFPDGRIASNPALASVAAGERLFAAGVADTTEDLQKYFPETLSR